MRESEEQARIVKLYRSLGAKVYSLSQYRPSGQAPGLPDLFVKFPSRKLSFSHEIKVTGGRMSGDQKEFAELCAACGDKHVVGGFDAGVAFLRAEGIVAPEWQP